jgi:hypothetical protein
MSIKPIFLISLPRSGSTLLQRILMGHPQIASKTESWLMLPLVYMLRKEGMLSEYNQRDAHYALADFIKELPNAKDDYINSLHDFALSLYKKQSNGSIYFLDKTPRYYLIAKELNEIFPEAKFIFLVRHPIQTIASIITTFKLKNIHFYLIDLVKGFSEMANAIQLLGDSSIILKYEDIVDHHTQTVDGLLDYLGLTQETELADNLDDRGLKGRFGDKKGTYQYQKIEDTSMHKWKSVFQDIVLKQFAARIISPLTPETLATYGYNKSALLDELDSVKATFTLQSFKSLRLLTTSRLIKAFNLNLFRKRIRTWSKEIVIN